MYATVHHMVLSNDVNGITLSTNKIKKRPFYEKLIKMNYSLDPTKN